LAGLVLVMIAAGWLLASRSSSAEQTPGPATVPTTAASIVTAPRPGRDVSWRVFAGMDLPVSATAGPYCLTETRASCFAHTSNGAAMAAAQILVRTFPFAGSATFEPTIAEQVTGPGAPALARLTQQSYDQAAPAAGIHDGAPIRSTDGWIAGYHLNNTSNPDAATVDVLIVGSGEGLGFTVYTVHLTWQNGDWRLVAPDWGDWRSNAHPVANPHPAEYRSYDTLGLGTGGAS
jgi:hypothetical protein